MIGVWYLIATQEVYRSEVPSYIAMRHLPPLLVSLDSFSE